MGRDARHGGTGADGRRSRPGDDAHAPNRTRRAHGRRAEDVKRSAPVRVPPPPVVQHARAAAHRRGRVHAGSLLCADDDASTIRRRTRDTPVVAPPHSRRVQPELRRRAPQREERQAGGEAVQGARQEPFDGQVLRPAPRKDARRAGTRDRGPEGGPHARAGGRRGVGGRERFAPTDGRGEGRFVVRGGVASSTTRELEGLEGRRGRRRGQEGSRRRQVEAGACGRGGGVAAGAARDGAGKFVVRRTCRWTAWVEHGVGIRVRIDPSRVGQSRSREHDARADAADARRRAGGAQPRAQAGGCEGRGDGEAAQRHKGTGARSHSRVVGGGEGGCRAEGEGPRRGARTGQATGPNGGDGRGRERPQGAPPSDAAGGGTGERASEEG